MGEARIRLWLDDVRDPVAYGCPGWTWAKTYEEAITLLETGRVEAASLDHDIGPDKTGNDVVLWMEARDAWPPRGVFVHSSNISAKLKMLQGIDNRFPELVRFRRPLMTTEESAALNDWLVDNFEGL